MKRVTIARKRRKSFYGLGIKGEERKLINSLTKQHVVDGLREHVQIRMGTGMQLISLDRIDFIKKKWQTCALKKISNSLWNYASYVDAYI